MEVSAISHQDGVVRLSRADEAQRLAVQKQTEHFQQQGVASGQIAPNVATSVAYSPALYAQAAQYQLYSQSGVLAAMAGAQAVIAPPPAGTEEPDAIHAVSSVSGSSVDAFM